MRLLASDEASASVAQTDGRDIPASPMPLTGAAQKRDLLLPHSFLDNGHSMTVDFESAGDILILRLRGRFATGQDTSYLRSKAEEIKASGKHKVLMDFHDVSYIDSTGIVLKSGGHLDADIIVTATGLQLQALGGAAISLDGAEVKPQCVPASRHQRQPVGPATRRLRSAAAEDAASLRDDK